MTLPSLATVADLEKRLGVPVGSLADEDLVRAQTNLQDASELVRVETQLAWIDTQGQAAAPPAVVTVVAVAALRAYNNPLAIMGESVPGYSWQADQRNIGPYLSGEEQATLQAAKQAYMASIGGFGGVGSVKTSTPWRRRSPRNPPWRWDDAVS